MAETENGPVMVQVERDDLAEFVNAAKMFCDGADPCGDDELAWLGGFVAGFAERYMETYHLPQMVMSYALRPNDGEEQP